MFHSLIKSTLSSSTRRIAVSVYRAYSSSEVPQFETLAVSEPSKHVYHVELARPKKLNTFSHNMWSEMKQCFSSLSDNPNCRVVVISGQGKHFTGGIDINSFIENASKANDLDDVARKARFLSKLIKQYQDGITCIEECVKPVLVVTHNACVGAGVDLVTAADMRYCTEDAWFQVKEVDIGLAADVGTLQRLPKVIGNTSTARELCFTARKVDSKEALELGLVSRVYPDKETALQNVLKIAEDIASKSPVAVQVTKQSLVYSQSRPNDEGLAHIVIGNTSTARELCFTARKVDSKEALELGLVSRVYPDKETALQNVLKIAEDIASKSPVAVQVTKQSLVYSQSRPNDEGLAHIGLMNQTMLQSEDVSKSVIASATKSANPEFDEF